jgi:hypothetical protein
MKFAFMFHYLQLLVQNYLELKVDAPTYEHARSEYVGAPMDSINASASSTIPAFLPRQSGQVMVSISNEDYDKIVGISSSWRVSSSGYVVTAKRVNGKNQVRYLHKEIFGDTCTHINGDRLDNRRSNLTASKKRRRPADFEIRSITELVDNPTNYSDGKKYYGEVERNKPNGFGMLVESKKRSLGWWFNGEFHSGIVMHLVPVPSRMANDVQVFHPVREAVLVHRNKVVVL